VKGIKAPTLMGGWLKPKSGNIKIRRRRAKREREIFFISSP
jgi:hypothetical protein